MCMNCGSSSFNVPDVKVVSVPVSASLQQISQSFPMLGIGGEMRGLTDADVQLHRLVGMANGVPMDHTAVVSMAKTPPTPEWAERHFMGTLAAERFDYTTTVKVHGRSTIEVSFSIASPPIDDLPGVSLTLDTQKRLVTKTIPDIRTIPDVAVSDLDPVSRMLFISSDDKQCFSRTCLILCLGLTALAALPCLAGGPALYAVCVGPAAAACIIGCKIDC